MKTQIKKIKVAIFFYISSLLVIAIGCMPEAGTNPTPNINYKIRKSTIVQDNANGRESTRNSSVHNDETGYTLFYYNSSNLLASYSSYNLDNELVDSVNITYLDTIIQFRSTFDIDNQYGVDMHFNPTTKSIKTLYSYFDNSYQYYIYNTNSLLSQVDKYMPDLTNPADIYKQVAFDFVYDANNNLTSYKFNFLTISMVNLTYYDSSFSYYPQEYSNKLTFDFKNKDISLINLVGLKIGNQSKNLIKTYSQGFFGNDGILYPSDETVVQYTKDNLNRLTKRVDASVLGLVNYEAEYSY